MPFEFTCPYCFKKTIVSELIVGRQGPCVGCGKTITIPESPKVHNPIARPIGSKQVVARDPDTASELPRLAFKVVIIASGLFVICGITYWIFWPSLVGFKQQRDVVACMNNLQRIAKALNAYAAEHGSYPPPVVTDAAGMPLHSWRVLILPYLGESKLHARYDLEKPWNAPENSFLIAECPSVYISPAAQGKTTNGESNYMLITGPGTIFPATGPLGPGGLVDGSSNTLLVVEVRNLRFDWTQPIDIDFSRSNAKIGALGANSIGGNHTGGATAVFADGRPVWLPGDTSPTLLRSIVTPNGQEPVDAAWFQGN